MKYSDLFSLHICFELIQRSDSDKSIWFYIFFYYNIINIEYNTINFNFSVSDQL